MSEWLPNENQSERQSRIFHLDYDASNFYADDDVFQYADNDAEETDGASTELLW